VLDDATSSVDMVTEMQIGRTLTADHGGRTRLIVTHRAATAAHADLVVWLDSGRARAVGRHAQLWNDPAYREVFGS
jgi:ATP-binding cassette subfamily B protein